MASNGPLLGTAPCGRRTNIQLLRSTIGPLMAAIVRVSVHTYGVVGPISIRDHAIDDKDIKTTLR